QVIEPAVGTTDENVRKLPYTGDGQLVHSASYAGLDWREAKKKITADLAVRNRGKATINYKLRDWLFSRQRYWGEPFPIVWVNEEDYRRHGSAEIKDAVTYKDGAGKIFCALPIPESALPLKLPE